MGVTALPEYARLETTGLWRAAPGAQGRSVGVAFGAATLVISDPAGRPLSHWSLAAVRRLNPGALPPLYGPDASGGETVEIDDPTMTEAIERVLAALAADAAPALPRGRRALRWGLAALVLAGLLWLPGALRQQTLGLVPERQRGEIGATLLGLVARDAGPPCRAPAAAPALARLAARLGGAAGGQIVILPSGPAGPLLLPGEIVVIPARLLEETEDPLVFAGHVLATRARGAAADPLDAVLRAGGLGGLLTLLSTGRIDADRLAAHAADLARNGQPEAPPDAILATFAEATVPATPWALATGKAEIAAADPLQDAAGDAAVMPDADWVALLGICGG